ncbi:MAG: rhodanese-like domain-containing protein [Pseudanabaenaceae cyanobacterium SKYGB_i_bin29]|nr:rhodanese-like domain-containing protein [Pseudanabaenaceae cyanobacterium SKYG29]MDW8422505.1 rhodanese-like domain-containing protein [Pseudanabaenaceae cyanobacterium SKYGB_i_bin29]
MYAHWLVLVDYELTMILPNFATVTVQELAQRLQQDTSQLQLVDVREPEELELARIPGFLNLPLSQFPQWYGTICQTLNPDKETLVLCHHGIRSAQVCAVLVNLGFRQVKNIAGGIDAYAREIDPTVGLY